MDLQQIVEKRKSKLLEDMSFNELKEYIETLEKAIFNISSVKQSLELIGEVQKLIQQFLLFLL